jgi:hypothetical protein
MFDWFLSVTTLLSNANLGWMKGSNIAWWLHIGNAFCWLYYSYITKQYGLISLAIATIIIDLISIYRNKKKKSVDIIS